MTIRALIVDDEALARRGLRSLLARDAEFEIVGEASNGSEAIESIIALSPDVVFLDLQMPDLTGLEVAQRFGDRMPLLVFVTAHDEHAVDAFDVQALDYLVKPFRPERFAATLARVKAHLQRSAGREGSDYAQRFLVKHKGSRVMVLVRDIEWIEADGNYVRLHATSGNYMMLETLQHLSTRLDRRQFIRVHRSAVVRLEAVKEIQPWFNSTLMLVLRGGARIQVSRGQREKVLAIAGS